MKICSATRDITIGGPPPTYYWKLAQIDGGATSPEEYLGNDMVLCNTDADLLYVVSPGSCTCYATTGLITGAIAFPNNNWGSLHQFDVLRSSAIDMTALAVGFTFRFWVYEATNDAIDAKLWFGKNSQLLIADEAWRITEDTLMTFKSRLIGEQTLTGSAMTSGAWHRILITWDAVTKVKSLKIDNNATVTQTVFNITFGLPSDAIKLWGTGLEGGGFPRGVLKFCEAGLWMEHVMTEDEMTADWNGGAGVTYP